MNKKTRRELQHLENRLKLAIMNYEMIRENANYSQPERLEYYGNQIGKIKKEMERMNEQL